MTDAAARSGLPPYPLGWLAGAVAGDSTDISQATSNHGSAHTLPAHFEELLHSPVVSHREPTPNRQIV